MEITITAEMKRIGASILAERYDLLGDEIDEDVATRVFEAMAAAASANHDESPRFSDVAS